MGLYISTANPIEWIGKNATPQYPNYQYLPPSTNRIAIMFLEHNPFPCIAVAFSKEEYNRLRLGRPDGRWFSCSRLQHDIASLLR